MPKDRISISVIKRLPRYRRYLGELLKQNIAKISSKELAEMMKLTASQIRQDLNCFGGFGQQGYGYNVKALYDEISKILGLDKKEKTILIGAGNLGRALAMHFDFEDAGFELIGIFDSNYKEIGAINGIEVISTEKIRGFCEENNPTAAILCIPKYHAKEVADLLIECGIKGFWNFSQKEFALDNSDIVVENVHLSDSMMTLSYRMGEIMSKNLDIEGKNS